MNSLIELYWTRPTDLPFTVREYGGATQMGPHVIKLNQLRAAGLVEMHPYQQHSYCLTSKGREFVARAIGGR